MQTLKYPYRRAFSSEAKCASRDRGSVASVRKEIPHAGGGRLADDGKRCDAARYCSNGHIAPTRGSSPALCVLDRTAYDSYDSFLSLAAAAAVTSRVRLVTMIAIGPLRNTALLAEESASLHAISRGRLTLGLAVGARREDYEVVGVDYRTRGRRLVEQLSDLPDLWEAGELAPYDPTLGAPDVLVGGLREQTFARVARYAQGYAHGGGPPRAFARMADKARSAWARRWATGHAAALGPGVFRAWRQGAGARSGSTCESTTPSPDTLPRRSSRAC